MGQVMKEKKKKERRRATRHDFSWMDGAPTGRLRLAERAETISTGLLLHKDIHKGAYAHHSSLLNVYTGTCIVFNRHQQNLIINIMMIQACFCFFFTVAKKKVPLI